MNTARSSHTSNLILSSSRDGMRHALSCSSHPAWILVDKAIIRTASILITQVMIVGSLVGLNGCNQPNATSTPLESVETTVALEKAEALESAGAKINRDASSGLITSINLVAVEINDQLADSLTQLKGLKSLALGNSVMSEQGWFHVGKLSGLEQLDLRACPVTNAELAAAVSGMSKLRALRMSGANEQTGVDDDGLSALSNCPDLRVLAADFLWVSEVGLQHLQAAESLSELYLKGTLVSDDSMETIAHWSKLRKLRLAATSISTAGLEKIAKLPLVDLDLSECSQLGDDSLVPVSQMSGLERLNLWRDAITDVGLQHLAGLQHMQWLNLDNTLVSNTGLDSVAKMPELNFLHLGSTTVSDEGLSKLFGLKKLEKIDAARSAISESGVAELTKALPKCSVNLKYGGEP
ncbi:MAG: hypothetical protein KDB03_14780 [Planctomycetales bacterium]|nr:hypothetical protein [Planctomycetales bacterium]